MANINKVVVDGVTYDIAGSGGGGSGAVSSVNGKTGDVVLTPADIGAKAVQTAKSSPSASGTAVAFIDTISQNAQGVITATKKTVQTATTSQSGLMSSSWVSRMYDMYDWFLTASGNFAPVIDENTTYPIKAGTLFTRFQGYSSFTHPAGWYLCRALVDITSYADTIAGNKDITYEELNVSDLYDGVHALALAAYPTVEGRGGCVSIEGTIAAPLRGLTIYGKSTQTGTPSTSSPAAISTVGTDGNIDIVRAGKNLLNIADFTKDSGSAIDSTDAQSGTITVTANGGTYGGASNRTITLKQGVTYVFSGNISGVNGGTSRVAVRNASNNIKASTTTGATGPFSFTFTPTEPGWYITVFASLGTALQGSVTYSNLQIEAAATATAFAPYVSAITSILPTPDGLPGIKVSSGGNYTDASGQQWVCDTIDKTAYVKRCETIASYNGETIPGAYMSSTGDLSTGATVVYALATPVTTDLTSAQSATMDALSGLDGDTKVYVNDTVTPDISVAAAVTVEAYVESVMATDESDMIANTSYAVNSFFMVGGQLYRATAAIATGETIRPGSNCVKTNVAEQLNALYARL